VADATVTAQMRMDNRQFLDATKQSTNEIRKVKAESKLLSRELTGVNSVSQGLAAVMTGNLSNGLASVSRGLSDLAPKAMAALGPIGLVVAALGAGVAAGRRLDSVLGISERIGRRFGGDTSDTDAMAVDTAFLRQRREAGVEAERIAAESARMAQQRLKGAAKLEADHAREVAEIRQRMSETTEPAIRSALRDRLHMMQSFHAQDVAAVREAEAAKLAAVKEAEAAKARAIQNASDQRTRNLSAETEAMRIAMLEGMARVEAEFDRETRRIDEQIAAPDTTTEQRGLLDEQRRIASQRRQRALDQLQQDQDQPEARRVDRGIPMRADSMASVGGFMGGERLNMPAQQKAERLQIENNQALKNNAQAVAALTDQVQGLASAMTGGVY
jgi:hypothetical protein